MLASVRSGAASLWDGAAFLLARPPLWRYALVPLLLTLVLGGLLGIGGALAARAAALHALGAGSPGALGAALPWIVGALATGIGLLLGALLGLSLALPASGPALERIARAVYAELGVPLPAERFLGGLLTSLAASLGAAALGIGGVALLSGLGLLLPPLLLLTLPLKAALVALLLFWDLADPSFSLLQRPIGQRVAWIRAHLGASLLFGGAAALALCIPGVGLLLLPAGVAGAAHLTARSARNTGPASSPPPAASPGR